MLLLLTIALVLVGAVALVIGFVNDAMFPIYLSIACSLLAAVVLVVFSRLSKARLEPATGAPAAIAGEPTGRLLVDREIDRDVDFPIPDYEDRRVAEIVPLLADLDLDELELVRAHEAGGRNRTTVIRRIDDLIAESDGAAVEEEREDTLVGAAASFGRDEEADLEEDFDEEEEAADEDLFPIADYDELSVAEILPLLDELTLDELEEVGDREADGQNRAAVLDRVDQLLDEGEAAEAAAPKKAAPKKTTVKKAAGKKATAKKATPKKAPAKKAAASKTTGKKAAAKKSPAKKAPAAKKATASKSGAKKSPAKKSPAKRAR